MPTRWAIQNGDNNQTSTWNDGATLGLPTSADDVFTNGFTVNMVANATYISMNNTARARDIATPAMTANNAPSPYVAAASSVAGASNDAFIAFNRVYFTNTFWRTSSINTGWLSMDFGTSVIIDAYTIFGTDAQTRNPRNWTFEGSSNNTTWTTLHTVTLPSAIATGSSYSSGSISNPTAYRYYRVNISLNGGSASEVGITELELYQPGTAALASGGSFNFNTAGVTATCTSTSASLSAGATNLITVTATTGTVTLNLGSSVTGLATAPTQIFNHTGNCNFNLSGTSFNAGTASGASHCINKSSTGTITITGSLFGGPTSQNAICLVSTAGNTIITGNVGFVSAISQSSGNLTITGNVSQSTNASSVPAVSLTGANSILTVTGNVVGNSLGGSSSHGISLTGAASQFTINGNVTGGSATSAAGISFGGTLGTVNGNVTGGGGTSAHGVNTATGGVNVTGNVTGNIGAGLVIAANSTIIGNVFGGSTLPGINNQSNTSFTVTVTGDVYASNTQAGISLTGTGTQVVNLTGNMYNTLGRMAIWCPNVFISNTATTLWIVDTGGGDYKFLYSADTTPNLPATTNVRSGVTYGPALSLTGTMVVPAASDTRKNVPVDNTVGTGELTSADIISGINASSDPLAVRLKNALTDVTAGNIISQYKDS